MTYSSIKNVHLEFAKKVLIVNYHNKYFEKLHSILVLFINKNITLWIIIYILLHGNVPYKSSGASFNTWEGGFLIELVSNFLFCDKWWRQLRNYRFILLSMNPSQFFLYTHFFLSSDRASGFGIFLRMEAKVKSESKFEDSHFLFQLC